MRGEYFSYGLLTALAIALVIAAATDLRRRQIDNTLNAASAITPAHTVILISINPLRFPSRKVPASTFQIRR